MIAFNTTITEQVSNSQNLFMKGVIVMTKMYATLNAAIPCGIFKGGEEPVVLPRGEFRGGEEPVVIPRGEFRGGEEPVVLPRGEFR